MDNFEIYLKDHQDKFMSIISPGGNHGDTLIHIGLMKKLEEYKIKYSCFNLENLYKEKVSLGVKYLMNIGLWKLGTDIGFKLISLPQKTELILFEGGGYMNDIWYGPTLLRQTMKGNKLPVTIGPHSYIFTKTRFHNYFTDCRPIHLFCREKYSLKYLQNKKLPENVKLSLSPDLALYLTKKDLQGFIEPRTGGYDLISFRKDKESIMNETKKNEIIEKSQNPLIVDVSILKNFKDFISLVYFAKYIYTDRLHVAILSKILGKKATLFGNNYYKNKGVWEYSLKNGIKYVEA
jgi:exopolysaccharide biosynthesis predicted pyruvyltransferase EpsI